jgi:general secretion pathway protein K
VSHNEKFAEKYRGYNFDELVNNIADYIDEDSDSLNGGDEGGAYRDVSEPGVTMPPNRSLRTIDELHQVAGMNDEFFNLLEPKLTVYGSKGVNVNYADKGVLLALDPTMTEEAADKVIARRNDPKQGGPFKSEQEFYGFLQPFSVDIRTIQEAKIPLLFDQEYNFRIAASGVASNVKREIIAITYDFPSLAARYADMIHKQRQEEKGQPITPLGGNSSGGGATGGTGGTGSATGGANQASAAKGRPTVVSWEEH